MIIFVNWKIVILMTIKVYMLIKHIILKLMLSAEDANVNIFLYLRVDGHPWQTAVTIEHRKHHESGGYRR